MFWSLLGCDWTHGDEVVEVRDVWLFLLLRLGPSQASPFSIEHDDKEYRSCYEQSSDHIADDEQIRWWAILVHRECDHDWGGWVNGLKLHDESLGSASSRHIAEVNPDFDDHPCPLRIGSDQLEILRGRSINPLVDVEFVVEISCNVAWGGRWDYNLVVGWSIAGKI